MPGQKEGLGKEFFDGRSQPILRRLLVTPALSACQGWDALRNVTDVRDACVNDYESTQIMDT